MVVQEVVRSQQQDLNADATIADIRQAISEAHELQVYGIALVKSGSVLKTSSGKIQRRACRSRFMAGQLDVIADWSENPSLTVKVRNLHKEVESLAQQLETSQS